MLGKTKEIYDVSGIILSGGKNRRMEGRNKALISVKGSTILQSTISLFRSIFREIILVTNNPGEYESYADSCRIVTDIIKNKGPLGGIHAGLSVTQRSSAFFVACDMPFLHNDVIRKQIDYFYMHAPDAVVPKIGDRLEPLHGMYSTALRQMLGLYLTGGSECSVRGFLKKIDTAFFELPDTAAMRHVFSNINSPQDLEKMKTP